MESSQTSQMELLAEIDKIKRLKVSILDVRVDYEYASVYKHLECNA